MNRPKKYLLIVFAFLAGIIFTVFYQKFQQPTPNEGAVGFKSCQKEYGFVSPEIDCGPIDERIDQINTTSEEVEAFINNEKQSGHVDEVSVFFRDLNTRRWFGINENINFYPASLAKLPFVMMMYKVAEADKKTLNESITLDPSDVQLNVGQHYQPAETLETGKSYPIHELLRRLLVFSDNAPINKLMEFSTPLRDEIFNDLGILFPPDVETGTVKWNITAKIYANFFRILYNLSYLRPEYSNLILEELSQATFKNGLVAGVPQGTLIAHKFGEVSETDPQTKEVHTILNDCGIVYKTNNPYILCIMTQGKQYDDLENIIKTISEKVYNSF